MLLGKKWILCGLVGSNEKERTDMKLENARMKKEGESWYEVRDKYVNNWSSTFFQQ